MISWIRHQKHALTSALRRLSKQPVATLLTALAMGVAISLPSGLYLMLGNLSRLAGDLPAQPEISLFLDADVTPAPTRPWPHASRNRISRALASFPRTRPCPP